MQLFVYAGLVAVATVATALPTGNSLACPAPAPSPCASYTLINTRGTTEPQGESLGFATMNKNIHNKRPGGRTYNVVYPADWDQNSTAATEDIYNQIHSTLNTNPDECFILEGYSQGATATVNALPRLAGAAFTAVKGVFLIGNPTHKAGLSCNVDMDGGDSTKDVNGLYVEGGLSDGIPKKWIEKTLDVCNFGDGVCDTKNGDGINAEHLAYVTDEGTQNMGTKFVLERLS